MERGEKKLNQRNGKRRENDKITLVHISNIQLHVIIKQIQNQEKLLFKGTKLKQYD